VPFGLLKHFYFCKIANEIAKDAVKLGKICRLQALIRSWQRKVLHVEGEDEQDVN